jgi:hypothetical protein
MIKQFTLALAAASLVFTPAAFADPEPRSTPELEAALAEGGERVVVDVLGAVCDFCALAMTRTFERRSEVAAADVDLDSKTLTFVLHPGENLDDETIADLIERSGYDLQGIRRGES